MKLYKINDYAPAYKASSYLESLLQKGVIVPEANVGLDKIYETCRQRLSQGRPSNSAASPNSKRQFAFSRTAAVYSDPMSSSATNNPPDNHNDDNAVTVGDESNLTEELILDREAVPNIVSYFDLPSRAESDLYRALNQTSKKLSGG